MQRKDDKIFMIFFAILAIWDFCSALFFASKLLAAVNIFFAIAMYVMMWMTINSYVKNDKIVRSYDKL